MVFTVSRPIPDSRPQAFSDAGLPVRSHAYVGMFRRLARECRPSEALRTLSDLKAAGLDLLGDYAISQQIAAIMLRAFARDGDFSAAHQLMERFRDVIPDVCDTQLYNTLYSRLGLDFD